MGTRNTDLNKLCDKLHAAQMEGDTNPSDKAKQVFVDKDANVQAMTAQTKEQADILNLLNLTVEEAAAAVKNETKLNDSLAKAEATEIVLLQQGKLNDAPLFFVPVKANN